MIVSTAMGRSLEGLTAEERLIHYRLLAEDALEKARTASSEELRAGFLTVAHSWHALAAEMERQVRKQMPATAANDPGMEGQDRA